MLPVWAWCFLEDLVSHQLRLGLVALEGPERRQRRTVMKRSQQVVDSPYSHSKQRTILTSSPGSPRGPTGPVIPGGPASPCTHAQKKLSLMELQASISYLKSLQLCLPSPHAKQAPSFFNKNVFQVTFGAEKFTDLRSWRPMWSCYLRSLEIFHRKYVYVTIHPNDTCSIQYLYCYQSYT